MIGCILNGDSVEYISLVLLWGMQDQALLGFIDL